MTIIVNELEPELGIARHVYVSSAYMYVLDSFIEARLVLESSSISQTLIKFDSTRLLPYPQVVSLSLGL